MDTERILRTGALALLPAAKANGLFARSSRWLVRTGGGTLQHEHETARAVRRRLNLSPRQYRKRLKAALRSGDGKQLLPFIRREVPPPTITRRVK